MASSYFAIVSGLSLAIVLSLVSQSFAVMYDDRAIIINGDRKLIISGSIHYPRSTPGMWPKLIKQAKLGGLNAIETYVFWNAHEPQYRQYDFTGNHDLVKFIKMIQDEGLYAILRIGPYVCAEWNYGGFPVWLSSLPGMHFRTNNPSFMNEMKNFTTLIVEMMKDNSLFATQGGPIILAQIENEYGQVENSYGEGGKEYLQWCANLAQGFNLGIPWIMCKQSDAPAPMIATCNDWYCDQWDPKNSNVNKNVPKIWTENWTGWFKHWGGRTPHRTAEDTAFAVARFFQLNGTMQNYYMYHGGTNFGETGGGPYITTSYDYDAPIDEYGNLNQPKWGHLKNLHEALYSMKDHIVYGDKTDIDCGQNKWATIFSYQGKRSCFFSNIDYNDQTLTFEGADLFLPGWSVSLSPDCFHEVYNTAKVNAQTSVMVNRPIHPVDEDDTPYKLEWQSTPEQIVHINRNGNLDSGAFVASNAVLDQKTVTNGTSDYLYLLTLYFHNSSDPQWVNKDIFLQVRTNGPIIHAFVNKRFVGSQYSDYHGHLDDYGFQFEREIRLVNGANRIVLASVSVGLPNYGPNFDYWGCGIVGPIQLIARSRNGSEPEVIKDISTNRWIHKTGLHGVDLEYHKLLHRYSPSWSAIPQIDRPFTWYKTNFLYPHGTDPVVVDLNGMGKGVAWINGINIGRYWPKNVASEEGCSIFCDYKNKYDSGKCSTGCGQPTQRYYHIPRDWLRPDNNLLVLFEEFGGNPQNVQIQTVTVGKVCANAYEWNKLELACAGGHNITKINFASFGNPQGKCGDYSPGRCHAIDSLDVVQKACLNQRNCTIDVNINSFALLPPECRQIFSYRLAVEAFC